MNGLPRIMVLKFLGLTFDQSLAIVAGVMKMQPLTMAEMEEANKIIDWFNEIGDGDDINRETGEDSGRVGNLPTR